MPEESFRVRISYVGVVKTLYEQLEQLDGVVREEYMVNVDGTEGEVVSPVWFTASIVYDTTTTSEHDVKARIKQLDGVQELSPPQ